MIFHAELVSAGIRYDSAVGASFPIIIARQEASKLLEIEIYLKYTEMKKAIIAARGRFHVKLCCT